MTDLLRAAVSRTGAAVLILLLAGGSAFAAASTLNTVPVRSQLTADASQTAEASESAEPSETPEATESAEPTETPEPSETPEATATASDQLQVTTPTTPDASPSSANVDRILAALVAQGIVPDTFTAADFQTLATKVGVGGAVRALLFWKNQTTTTWSVDQIVAMFQGGEGWGKLAKDLELSVNPGIGSVMSNGHGKAGTHGNSNKNSTTHGNSGTTHGNSGH